MEPVTSYCYSNEPAMVAAAMQHAQAPGVYPASSVEAYSTHYTNYSSAVPVTAYHGESPYHHPQSSSPSTHHQVWPTVVEASAQQQSLTYPSGAVIPQLQSATQNNSISSPTNPLTPPQSGSPHSSIYTHEENTLMHHSPSGSPHSVHETSFQPLSLPSISGSIHLPGKYAIAMLLSCYILCKAINCSFLYCTNEFTWFACFFYRISSI